MATRVLDEPRHTRASSWERTARLVLFLSGLGAIASGLFAPALRDFYDFPGVTAHVFVVGGLALALAGLTFRTAFHRSGALLALALFGQACALHLIYAPAYDVYQHFIPPADAVRSAYLPFLLGLVAQTIIVFALGSPIWPAVATRVRQVLRPIEAAALLALLGFGAVVVSARPLQIGWELLLTAWIALVGGLNVILAVEHLPAGIADGFVLKRADGSAVDLDNALRSLSKPFPWLVAAWTVVVSALLAWFVFEAVPHIPDDISYLFQAKYLASGRLYLPAPPDAASFEVGQVAVDAGKWFGYGFPGWPSVLALGVLAGVPWLVNPLLAGIIVLLLHAVVTRSHGRRTAHAAIALLAVSPWFLYMSASFMTHTVTIVWTLLALFAVQKERADGRGYWGGLAGLALGALFLTRPLEAILAGSVIGLWALGLGGQRLRWRALIALVVAGIALASLIFPYSKTLTGSAFVPAQQKWTDLAWYPGADRLGFGPNIGNVGWTHLDPLPGHGPLDVLINANRNFYMANVELFGWSFGSLFLVFVAFVVRGLKRRDFIFAGIALATIAGHSLYWFSGGPDLGARYWYQAMIPLVVLTVVGVQAVQERLSQTGGRPHRVAVCVALATLVAFPNMMAWRTFGKYHRYRGMSADVRQLAARNRFGHSLVFVRAPDRVDYTSAFIMNPRTLADPGTIYVLDLGPEQREKLKRAFPDRTVWVIGYPTAERTRMQVLARP